MNQRTLLVAGVAMMVAGFLLGAVVGPLVDGANAPAAGSQQLTPRPGGHRGPGFARPFAPGGGYFGNVPPRIPTPTPSPNS